MLNLAFVAIVQLRRTLADSIVIDLGAEASHFGVDVGFELVIWEELVDVRSNQVDTKCMSYTESSHVWNGGRRWVAQYR